MKRKSTSEGLFQNHEYRVATSGTGQPEVMFSPERMEMVDGRESALFANAEKKSFGLREDMYRHGRDTERQADESERQYQRDIRPFMIAFYVLFFIGLLLTMQWAGVALPVVDLSFLVEFTKPLAKPEFIFVLMIATAMMSFVRDVFGKRDEERKRRIYNSPVKRRDD